MSRKRFTDEELRSAFRAFAERTDDDGELDPNRIWDAVCGELPADQRQQVVDEIARHPGSALFWRLAQELQTEEAPGSSERRNETVSRAPWRLVRHVPWTAAAALALAVGTWAMWPARAFEPEGRRRAPDVPASEYRAVNPGGVKSEVVADRPLDRHQFRLRWSAIAEARYDVRATTESLVEIASGRDLSAPEFVVRSSELGSLAPGSRVLWQVTAHLPSGGEVRSETFVAVIE